MTFFGVRAGPGVDVVTPYTLHSCPYLIYLVGQDVPSRLIT